MMRLVSVKVDDHGYWLQPKQLREKFDLSRSTLYGMLQEMRELPKYKGLILDYSQTLHLVNLEAFMDFLRSKDKAYLRA